VKQPSRHLLNLRVFAPSLFKQTGTSQWPQKGAKITKREIFSPLFSSSSSRPLPFFEDGLF
jgi:hypothetical protein